jgi:hypothetical protein
VITPLIVTLKFLESCLFTVEEKFQTLALEQLEQEMAQFVQMVMLGNIVYKEIVVFDLVKNLSVEIVHCCQRSLKPLLKERCFESASEVDQVQHQQLALKSQLFFDVRRGRDKFLLTKEHQLLLELIRYVRATHNVSAAHRKQDSARLNVLDSHKSISSD